MIPIVNAGKRLTFWVLMKGSNLAIFVMLKLQFNPKIYLLATLSILVDSTEEAKIRNKVNFNHIRMTFK